MNKDRINMALDIYNACSEPLYLIFSNIPEDDFNWKPSPESRSINELFGHLIRVDNSYLKKLNINETVNDPKDASPSVMLSAVKEVHSLFKKLIVESIDDNSGDEEKFNSILDTALHVSQHYLYHLSQMIYLRRANDRNWESPWQLWEKAAHIISSYLNQSIK
jgi:uncharacterized damage-inducible protein DinB